MFWNKKKYANGYSTVSVNGKTVRVRGNSISIINDQIIVDGKPLEEALDQPNITVIVEGDCRSLNACGNVEVKGNVTGNVNASGSVTCGDVGGDIDASGSVRCTRK